MKIFLKSFSMAVLAAGLVACGGGSDTPEKAGASSGNPNTGVAPTSLRIATEAAYAPFASVNSSGEIVGFDIDIMNALCDRMKTECNISNQEWNGLIPGLKARKFDAVIAAMSVNEDRRKAVDFTDVYYKVPARFVSKKGAAEGVDFTPGKLQGKTVAVLKGSTHDKFLTEQFGSAIKVTRSNDTPSAFIDLQNGRVDMVFSEESVLREFLDQDRNTDVFELAGPQFTDDAYFEGFAIAVDKGRSELVNRFNDALESIRADGTYDNLVQKHFE
jgi:arginine/ornithine transport system substrate-binding protein